MVPHIRSLAPAFFALTFAVAAFAQVPTTAAPDPATLGSNPNTRFSGSQPSVVVVIDSSAASPRTFAEMRSAASTFIRSMGEERDVAVVAASDKPALVADFNSEAAAVVRRVERLKPHGAPALQSAVALAAQRASTESDNAAVVVFARNPDSPGVAVPQTSAANPQVPVYVIASPDSKWRVQSEMQQIAVKSGGTAFFPSNQRELRDVVKETATRVTGHPELEGDARPEKNLLRGYERLIVEDIPVQESAATSEAAGGENLLMQQVLVARIRKAKLFPVVVNSADQRGMDSASSSPIGNALQLRATVTEFRHGSKAARQFLAGFKGGAKMKLRVILVDASTNKPVLAFSKEATSASGLWGGSDEHVQAQAMLTIANEIVDELKRAR